MKKFLGLLNTTHEQHLPEGALVVADNVLVNKSGAIERRPGHAAIFEGSISSSYGTRDQQWLFVVSGGSLFVCNGVTMQEIYTGLSAEPCLWCEESAERVFCYSTGRLLMIDRQATVAELPIPTTPDLIAFHNARLVVVDNNDGLATVMLSEAFAYTDFTDTEQVMAIPDVLHGIDSVNGTLVMAGASTLWMLDSENRMRSYPGVGALPGKPIHISDNTAWIWTRKGLVKYPEFQLVTESNVSVKPGQAAAITELEYNGSSYLIAINDGQGTANNAAFSV